MSAINATTLNKPQISDTTPNKPQLNATTLNKPQISDNLQSSSEYLICEC